MSAPDLSSAVAAFRRQHARGAFSAGQLAVRRDGQLLASEALGDGVTPDSPFQVMSASKPVVAFVVARLEDAGELDVHRRVSAVLPGRNAAMKTRTVLVALLGATLLLPAATRAQTVDAPPPPPAQASELSAQDREVLATANSLAGEAAQIMERWLAAKEITEERLRSRLYYPVTGTEPTKFTTDYDALADRDFVAPQEKALARSTAFSYAIVCDLNGYVPTHNQKYAQPLTGNRAVDLVANRTKRIFGDRVGLLAARNNAPYLIQHYERDTGEPMTDLSVPVLVHGRRWGSVRIGYQRETK